MGQAMAKVQQTCCGRDIPKNPDTEPRQNNMPQKPQNFKQNKNKQQNKLQTPESIEEKKEASEFSDSGISNSGNLSESSNNDEKSGKSSLQGFLKIKQIGQGAFGKVYLVKKNNPMSTKQYAMKVIKKSDINKYGLTGFIQIEKEVLKNNKHPFIVDLKYSFQTQSKAYMVMENVQGGALYPYLRYIDKREKEKVARFVMAQTILAIEILHNDLHVIYRDLKPENILVTEEGNIKLTDFGLSKVFNPNDPFERFKGMGGTQEYFAPEVVTNQGWNRLVDIWGLGIFLYEILAGQCPFIPDQRKGLTQSFVYQITHVKLQIPSFFSEEAADLIKRLLQKKPEDRLGADDFEDIKRHSFFKGIDWKQLGELKTESPLKKYVQNQLRNSKKQVLGLPPRPIIETFQKDPALQIPGFSYKPPLMD